MRALTVRQPWAWQIIHQAKNVENRTRNIAGRYRGVVAIHAGKAADTEALRQLPGRAPAECTAPRIFVYGAVLGVVDLVDVHHSDDCGDGCSEWAMSGHHHLVLATPRPLARPIPATGRLGLWRPDEALEVAIREQIEETDS